MGGHTDSTGHTVSEDGVTVRQRYTDTEFDLPSVVFELTSEHDEPTAVRFLVPDIEARKVGFHPEFKSDAWTIDDDQLVFETTVGPEEEVTTLYALDTDERSVFERAMGSLRIDRVVPEGEPDGPSLDLSLDSPRGESAEDSTGPEGSAGPTAEPTATDGSVVTGPSIPDELEPETDSPPDGTGRGESEPVEKPSDGEADEKSTENETEEEPTKSETTVDEPSENAATGGGAMGGGSADGVPRTNDDDHEGDASDDASQSVDGRADGSPLEGGSTDELVEALVDRLEAGDLTSAHREQLAASLPDARGADDARIDSLQTRVSDIEAFTTPIEQLLDRHGPPAAAFDAFERRLAALETLEDRVERLDARLEMVDEHEDALDNLERRVGGVDERVATLGDEFEATTARLEETLAEIETAIDQTQERLETVETALDDVRDEATEAGTRADDIGEGLADIGTQLDALEKRLEGLTGDWEEMEDDIAALQEWRSDLARTFDVFDE